LCIDLSEFLGIWLIYDSSNGRNSVYIWLKSWLYYNFDQESPFQYLGLQLDTEKHSEYYLC